MVNEPLRLPFAVYGKPEISGDAGCYRFLVRHPAFDPPALDRALRRCVTALEWKPGSHRHKPVFGLVREGEETLVARFLDVGRDANGRPHTLRVECVLWSEGECPGELLEGEHWNGIPEAARETAVFHPDGKSPSVPPGEPGVIRFFGDRDQFVCATGTRIIAS